MVVAWQVWEVKLWKQDPSVPGKKGPPISESRVTLLCNLPVPNHLNNAGDALKKYATASRFLPESQPRWSDRSSFWWAWVCPVVPTTLPKRAEAAIDSGGRRYCQSTSQAHGAARRAFMSRATLLAAPCSQPSRRLPLPWTRGVGKRTGVIDDAEGDTHEEAWAWAGRRRPDGGRGSSVRGTAGPNRLFLFVPLSSFLSPSTPRRETRTAPQPNPTARKAFRPPPWISTPLASHHLPSARPARRWPGDPPPPLLSKGSFPNLQDLDFSLGKEFLPSPPVPLWLSEVNTLKNQIFLSFSPHKSRPKGKSKRIP
nr:unnamed protein product [Digitaria exilis]